MPTVTQIARTDQGWSSNDPGRTIRLSVAEKIALLDPNENPFTLMTQKLGKITIRSTKRSWISDELRPEVDQINAGAGYTDEDVTLTVDNITYFAPGDLWRVFDSGETLYVSAIASTGDSTITVTRGYGGASGSEPGTPTALLDNDYLEFIGNTLAEGATSPNALHTTDVQHDNYSQIQRTVLDLTNTNIAMLFEAEESLPYEVRKKGIEHARKLEKQDLFGGKPYSDTSGDIRASGGLFWWIGKFSGANRNLTTTTLTETLFLNWLQHCFRYGGPKRVLYASPVLCQAMSAWAAPHLHIKSGKQMFGVSVNIWHTPHGDVMVVKHKMLEGPTEGGTVLNHAFVVDMDDIKYCNVKGRDTALLNNRQQPDADKKRSEYLTEHTLQVKNPKFHGKAQFVGFAA